MTELASVSPPPRLHVLYRMYDATDALLYVGITMNVEDRFADHRAMKAWWAEVVDIKLEHFPTREAVEQAERDAIRTERPRFNVVHSVDVIRKQRTSGRTVMKPVNFRAPGTDWEDALATADAAGEHLPDELRNFLAWYARKPGARAPRRPEKAVRASDTAAS